MKKYLALNMRHLATATAIALGTYAFVAPQVAEAQSASEKIQLMAETLRARDSGNLQLAKQKAEELIKVAPNDENVQRLLASINREMERRGAQDNGAVYGAAAEADIEAAMEGNVAAGPDASAEALASSAASEQQAKIEAAKEAMAQADALAEVGSFSEANSLLSSASASLTLNTATAPVLEQLEEKQAELIYKETRFLIENDNLLQAEELLQSYIAAGGDSRRARSLAREIDAELSNPYDLSINEVSPDFVEQTKTVRELLKRGRAQFLNGDYDGAAATFKEIEARDANNAEAKFFSKRIAEILGEIHEQNYYKTREQMLTEVDQSWERPKVFDIGTGTGPVETDPSLQRKMEQIVLPQVNFSGMELTRVIETLFELSKEYDPDGEGVNIVPLFDPNQSNPRVNISLRNLNLDRILQFVTQQVNFSYDVGADAVTVARDDTGGSINTVTEFFPISRATRVRLIGYQDGGGGGSTGPVDPFAPATQNTTSSPSGGEEVEKLKEFFQNAGVNFEIPGTSLAFDGEQLIVTQTRRNLERMRAILRRYNEIKQVEIEAKFLEVSQNDLEEVGFNWSVGESARPILDDSGAPVLDQFGNPMVDYERDFITNPRTLNDAFAVDTEQSAIILNDSVIAQNSAPTLATAIDLATNAGNVFTATGWSVAGADVDLAIRALSRKTGSDLMSAPKVTVLSGKRANITVAQELRYPESYGDIESTVSNGGGGSLGTAGSGVAITAGTPQDFVTRNVGIEMAVTPNVESDDTISLILEPRVTEFEGFVEYGGPSVALTGGLTVTVPAGFYQPIFSTREVSTEVTVFDGATVVMGGLTRDEVLSVNDRVPVLGDIPGIGRLFRSEGETRQKRNLLIFVTANLISPGGSPARQNYRNVDANALFQNPTIMTPSGTANRSVNDQEE